MQKRVRQMLETQVIYFKYHKRSHTQCNKKI